MYNFIINDLVLYETHSKEVIVFYYIFFKLGIRKIFEPRQADFSPMTNDRGTYVTNIEQAVTVTIRNYVDPNTLLQNYRKFRPNFSICKQLNIVNADRIKRSFVWV